MTGWWFLIVALVASVAACQKQGEQAGMTEEELAVDAATVEQTIRAELDRYEQAALAGDTATMTSFYADDAILQPPGMPRSEGIAAIRSAYQQMYSAGNPTQFSIDAQTIVVAKSGDLAYATILKPTESGEWKIVVDTWNSDAMPGAPAPAETSAPEGQ